MPSRDPNFLARTYWWESHTYRNEEEWTPVVLALLVLYIGAVLGAIFCG